MDVNFALISKELNPLLKAFPNLIKREWPAGISADNGLQLLLHGIAAVTENTYQTILWIIAERPDYPERKLEYVLSVSPLVRSILDQVMTLCFLSEDLQKRVLWYHKAGWHELHERHIRELERYKDNPTWKERIASNEALLEKLAALVQLTPEEKAAPQKSSDRWPNPGSMAKASKTEPAKQFLTYLRDWYYRELSQETHLSEPGLIAFASRLILDLPSEELRENLGRERSMVVVTTVTLVVSLLSEIQAILKFPNMSSRLNYLWGILQSFWPEPKELYEQRYRELLMSEDGGRASVTGVSQ